MNKKVLFTATVDSHIKHFHLPYLKYFKDNGYEVHVATNGDEKIPYCDVKHKISFERSPYKINNLKAIKDLRKIVNKEALIPFGVIASDQIRLPAASTELDKNTPPPFNTTCPYTPLSYGVRLVKIIPSVGLISTRV